MASLPSGTVWVAIIRTTKFTPTQRGSALSPSGNSPQSPEDGPTCPGPVSEFWVLWTGLRENPRGPRGLSWTFHVTTKCRAFLHLSQHPILGWNRQTALGWLWLALAFILHSHHASKCVSPNNAHGHPHGYMHTHTCTQTHTHDIHRHKHMYCIYIYIYMCVCIYVYVYACI